MSGYKLSNNEGFELLTVVTANGDVLSFNQDHPRFAEAKQKVVVDNDFNGIEDLLNPAAAIETEFAKLSTEISVRGGKLFLEGEELAGSLANKIISVYEAGLEYGPFVAFLEKLRTNPNTHSIDHLYRWLEASNFALTQDGDIVGYKGVRADNTAVHAGPVIRNGVPTEGHALYVPGDVIEMDRQAVTFDPDETCSAGLHVGTWSYARSFGHKVLKVIVNPKYVVSVPNDCSGQKMRVCRFTVAEEVTSPVEAEYDAFSVTEEVHEHVHWASNDEPVKKFSQVRDVSFTPYPNTAKTDTTKNHLKQRRDAFGRFIK